MQRFDSEYCSPTCIMIENVSRRARFAYFAYDFVTGLPERALK